MRFVKLTAASALGALYVRPATAAVPDPPALEPIKVVELPMPQVTTGSCTPDINTRGTGCISHGMYGKGFQSGSFLPDGRHIVAYVTFTGAPEAPDPANLWKCVICGVPAQNSLGKSDTWDYPHAFQDGRRLLAGTNIVDCGNFSLTDADYTPERTFIYPIRWNVTPDGSGAGGAIREVRIHPDDVHLGFSSFGIADGAISQFGYFSRLQFNPSPTTGEPLVARYDLVNVTRLYSPDNTPPWTVNGDRMLRGFSGRGGEVSFIGYSTESCNVDLYAAELATGSVRRLTAHLEYADPPYLIDRYGDRGDYFGQKINEAGSGVAGSGAINDPEWNGRADPGWSPDGTKIAYWQDMTASPACGVPGGRFVRFMLATLTSREPYTLPKADPVSDVVPWGTPCVPGDTTPRLPRIAQGTCTLLGTASGSANVTIKDSADDSASIKSVAVQYSGYSEAVEAYSTKKTSADGFHLSVDAFINTFEANGTLTTTVDDSVYLQPLNYS
ncbi:hypothetical protein F5B21DRAFT_524284 [Xylaria acuta]|nr:hypothetical protein F5B21DRAFT_524284 [Xylaria acuta]